MHTRFTEAEKRDDAVQDMVRKGLRWRRSLDSLDDQRQKNNCQACHRRTHSELMALYRTIDDAATEVNMPALLTKLGTAKSRLGQLIRLHSAD